MIDGRVHIKVRIKPEPMTFKYLIAGRCFILAENIDSRPNKIFFKLTKSRAQLVDDENHRLEMSPDRPVCEVVLVSELIE